MRCILSNVAMAFEDHKNKIFGFQFHPESFLTKNGKHFIQKNHICIKTLNKVMYESLWNTKGVFTTIRLIGLPPKFLFLKEHLRNLNKSLKIINIDFVLRSSVFRNLLRNKIKMNIKYDHLLRLAV